MLLSDRTQRESHQHSPTPTPTARDSNESGASCADFSNHTAGFPSGPQTKAASKQTAARQAPLLLTTETPGELCGKTRHTFFSSARKVPYRGEPLYG